MNIDWSKAPEGATHKDTSCPGGFWYKFDYDLNTAAFCPPGQTEWVPSGPATAYDDGSLESMVSRDGRSCEKRIRETKVEELVGRFALHNADNVDWKALFQQMYDCGVFK